MERGNKVCLDSRSFGSQLAAELDSTHQEGETDAEVRSKSRLIVLLWRAMSHLTQA